VVLLHNRKTWLPTERLEATEMALTTAEEAMYYFYKGVSMLSSCDIKRLNLSKANQAEVHKAKSCIGHYTYRMSQVFQWSDEGQRELQKYGKIGNKNITTHVKALARKLPSLKKLPVPMMFMFSSL
jgi:hypothetical protein